MKLTIMMEKLGDKISFEISRKNLVNRKSAGLILGAVMLAIVLSIQTSLTTQQQRLLSVIFLTITYWVFRSLPIPVTSILALATAVMLGVAPAQTVFGAFSSPTLFLLIGGFIITQAMIKHGLGHRMALQVLSIPGVSASTYRVIIVFGALATLLSSVIDNGAVAAMLLPIGVGLIRAFSVDIMKNSSRPNEPGPFRFSTALMLMTAYGATMGALITPFGDASNMVGWEFIQKRFHVPVSMGSWMALAIPTVIVLFILLSAVVLLLNKPEIGSLPEAARIIAQQRRKIGEMSRGEINTACAFGLAIFLWLLPPVTAFVTGYSSAPHRFLVERLPPPVVAVIAACLLFVLPLGKNKGFTLSWRKDIVHMDWGPVLLVGSALALGKLMAETGLAHVIGAALAEKVDGLGALGICFFAAAGAIMISELTTNLVSISVLVPIIPTIATAAGGDPLETTLIATFAAVYGFMLPISTSANAIVYGSGQIPFLKMVKTGIIVDISGVIVITVSITTMLHFVKLF